MSEAFGRALKVGTRRVCDSLRTLKSLGDPGCLLTSPTLPPQEVDVAAARHGSTRLSSTTMSSLPIPDALFDIAIVGAGIAGAAMAYFCAEHARVLLLEREGQPGMHSTGRSAAMFMESYGPPQVRSLTRASRPFFESPPACFGTAPLIVPRGALSIGSAAQRVQLQALHEQLRAEGCPAELLSASAAAALVPVLRAEAAAAAVLDPLACDLDVHALHQGFLRGARARGAVLACDSEVLHLSPTARGWDIETAAGRHHAAVVVNAAGAWVDELAGRAGVAPIGIQPRRRSAFVFAPPEGLATHGWPAVSDLDESFYFKPDAGLASKRRPPCASSARAAAGPGCALSLPMATWSAVPSRWLPVSSGSRRWAAMASRPARRWLPSVPPSCSAGSGRIGVPPPMRWPRRWHCADRHRQSPRCHRRIEAPHHPRHPGVARTTVRTEKQPMARLNVNGQMLDHNAEPDTPLLWVLREQLGLTGTKYGCGVAQCGSCTVHIDGAPVRSCVVPVSAVQPAQKVVTIEGLSARGDHPLQKAWVQLDVPQCGYCQSGMIMAAAALLKDKPRPSDADIDAAITNICRCGTYNRVRAAIKSAAGDSKVASLDIVHVVQSAARSTT